MPDTMVTLKVPATDVATLRELVIHDLDGFAEAGERESVDEIKPVLDSLQWCGPDEGDRELSGREGFVWWMLWHFAETAVGDMEPCRSAAKRRVATLRLKSILPLLEQLDQ